MTWKTDLRRHDGHLSERTLTPDPATAEAAFRALLAREDLIGQPIAARLVSPLTRRAIYFSRFDRGLGDGRIHPSAPLDLSADQDLTAIATKWRPSDNIRETLPAYTLPPETESALRAYCARAGSNPSAVVAEAVRILVGDSPGHSRNFQPAQSRRA